MEQSWQLVGNRAPHHWLLTHPTYCIHHITPHSILSYKNHHQYTYIYSAHSLTSHAKNVFSSIADPDPVRSGHFYWDHGDKRSFLDLGLKYESVVTHFQTKNHYLQSHERRNAHLCHAVKREKILHEYIWLYRLF